MTKARSTIINFLFICLSSCMVLGEIVNDNVSFDFAVKSNGVLRVELELSETESYSWDVAPMTNLYSENTVIETTDGQTIKPNDSLITFFNEDDIGRQVITLFPDGSAKGIFDFGNDKVIEVYQEGEDDVDDNDDIIKRILKKRHHKKKGKHYVAVTLEASDWEQESCHTHKMPEELQVTLKPAGPLEVTDENRRLLKDQYAFYPNCYSGDSKLHTLDIGVITDKAYYQQVKSVNSVRSEVEYAVASASAIYKVQMNIQLRLSKITIATDSVPSSWPTVFKSSSSICNDLDKLLSATVSYSQGLSSSEQAASIQLFSGCTQTSGYRGVAYMNSLCQSGYNVGVNIRSKTTWRTYAHELGHNFGAHHSFENGVGTTGGIMDYGNGKIIGTNLYRFRMERRDEMCGVLNSLNNCGYFSTGGSGTTYTPTAKPTNTKRPTSRPSPRPTKRPTQNPTSRPTPRPTKRPTKRPTSRPTNRPTKRPTKSN